MYFDDLRKDDNAYIANTYARFNVGLASGKGAVCRDFDGKEYIDLSGGIAVNSLGFCDDEWAAAVAKQAATLQHTSNLYYTEPCVQLAKTLCRRTGMDKVFFGNSGAEANEGAIKTARKYSSDRYGSGRSDIVTLGNSFHGRTISTLIATGQKVFHKHFFPFTPGFDYACANDFEKTASLITDKTCAVMLEMIQGEGGVYPLDPGYVSKLAAYCADRDILVLVDEVQTGIGRTGRLLCCEHYGLKPDIITLAKGLGGGLPIGAVLFSSKTSGVLGKGDHGSTFGGNPVCCAGAQVVLDRLDDDMLSEIEAKGRYLKEKLEKLPHIKTVHGMGLMLGAALDGAEAVEIVRLSIESGLILLTAKANLRFLPPLNITYEELDRGVALLKGVLSR